MQCIARVWVTSPFSLLLGETDAPAPGEGEGVGFGDRRRVRVSSAQLPCAAYQAPHLCPLLLPQGGGEKAIRQTAINGQ